MDCALTLIWDKETGGLYSGMIVTSREILNATWDGSQYVPNSPIGNPSAIMVYVTGVPITDERSLQYCLEENPIGDVQRKWLVDETLVTTDERRQVLDFRYITLTWDRFKEICHDLLDVHITDADLLKAVYEA